MTDTNNSTAELDKAQSEPESSKEEYSKNLQKFIGATFGSGIGILIWCVLSLLVIYGCKVAQANILPSDISCYPYSEQINEINIINTYIFSNSMLNSPRVAMKLQFPDPNNSYLDPLLKSIGNYKCKGDSSVIGQFFNELVEIMISKNFGFYNTIFSFLNSLPEFALIIFGPILGVIVFVCGMYYNLFYFCYAWFGNLGWLWKKNANVSINPETGEKTYESPPKWIDIQWNPTKGSDKPHTDSWVTYTGRVMLTFMFVFLFMIIFLAQGGIILAIAINCLCGAFFLTYNFTLNGKDSSFTSLFPYFFKYNKLIIMGLFSIFAVTNAYTFLGSTSAVFALITLAAIYKFNIIEMFVSIKDDSERESVTLSTAIAKRKCGQMNEKGEMIGYRIINKTGGAVVTTPTQAPSAPPMPVTQAPSAPPMPVTQPSVPNNLSGGKSNFNFNSSNIMKELEKFNKKYGKYLNNTI
jgi:hypothetical protein